LSRSWIFRCANVMIEARIVEANVDYDKSLGVRLARCSGWRTIISSLGRQVEPVQGHQVRRQVH